MVYLELKNCNVNTEVKNSNAHGSQLMVLHPIREKINMIK